MDASKPGIDDKYRFKHDNLNKSVSEKKNGNSRIEKS